MNSIFKKRQVSFLIQLILFTIIIFAIHSYLASYFIKDTLFFPLWQIYVFHFLITYSIYTAINYKYSKGKKEIFNTFMLSTLLKMVISILFLLPLLLSDFDHKKPDVFNFFGPYFLFLAFEVYSISAFLKES
jgi:hypothetical protein